MLTKDIMLMVLGLMGSASVCLANECSCDVTAQSREFSEHHVLHSSSKVKFKEASKRGADYTRPGIGGSPLWEKKKKTGRRLAADVDCKSEQVHISLGYDLDSAIISFASPYLNTTSTVYYTTNADVLFQDDMSEVMTAVGTVEAYSEILYLYSMALDPRMGAPYTTSEEVLKLQDTSSWAYDHKTGEHYSNWNNVTEVLYGGGQYNNPDMMYQSPAIHTVPITNLQNGVKYYYRVEGSCDVHQFTLPYYSFTSEDNAAAYPFTMGITGDLGQTEVSAMSLAALAAMQPAAVILVGDLSYADGWCPRWDTFGQLFETLAASVPVLTTGGNHENGFAENNVPYYARYSTPHVGSGSPDQTYWGREVGPVHLLSVYTYAGYTPDSLQYQWLENYLATKINRARTPWVVVLSHMSWYNSNTGHWMETEHSRSYFEPLLYKYGVDVVIGGHVHSYERSHAVYNNTLDDCGMVTVNLGDGGNYEGAYVPWRIDPDTPNGMPEWSAFRESSFGVGDLTVVNSTHAFYGWHRHACGSDEPGSEGMNFSTNCRSPGDNSEQNMETSDTTWLVRPSADACPNRHMGTSSFMPTSSTATSDTDDDDDSEMTSLEFMLIIAVGVLFLSTLVLGILLYRQKNDNTTGETNNRESLIQNVGSSSA